jgi:hypothetical protein
MNRKAQYSSPPCTYQLKSAPFDIENIFYFLYKQATLMRFCKCAHFECYGMVEINWLAD